MCLSLSSPSVPPSLTTSLPIKQRINLYKYTYHVGAALIDWTAKETTFRPKRLPFETMFPHHCRFTDIVITDMRDLQVRNIAPFRVFVRGLNETCAPPSERVIHRIAQAEDSLVVAAIRASVQKTVSRMRRYKGKALVSSLTSTLTTTRRYLASVGTAPGWSIPKTQVTCTATTCWSAASSRARHTRELILPPFLGEFSTRMASI